MPSPAESQDELGATVLFPEYERAVRALFWTAVNELMACNEPVLGMIRRVGVDEVPAIATLPSEGDRGASRPLRVEMSVTQPFDCILRVDVEQWAATVFESSLQALDCVMPQFFAALNDVCDAAGQTVYANGRPLDADLLLEMLEKLKIEFDDTGAPELPTGVVSPEDAKRIFNLPPFTPEQQARFDRIIETKRREHNAERRVRRLDKDSSRT